MNHSTAAARIAMVFGVALAAAPSSASAGAPRHGGARAAQTQDATAVTLPAPSQPVAPSVPVAAFVPREGDDVLRLRDGSILRGRIAERRADGTTIIVMLTVEIRTIADAEIVSTEHPLPP